MFHEASGLDASAVKAVQATVRRRVLRAAQRRKRLSEDVAQAMAEWAHDGGFSVDAQVRIEAHDRAGLERLRRYCARPAFARERLREIDAEHLVYESIKPSPGGRVSLVLTALERLDRLAAVIPPPRRHRHRYVGVLAPNAPLRAGVTALAQAEARLAAPEVRSATGDAELDEPLHRKAARLLWARLIARIDEVLPLLCPPCGGPMRIIAFINDGAAIRDSLARLGQPTSPPRLLPARGPPLWEMPGAAPGQFDPQFQPAPDYAFDQRIAW